nr:MAG: pX protein [Otus scops adenovirus]
MPSVLLTGGRARRGSSRRRIRLPKLPRAPRRRRAPVVLPTTATASASERAALQNLAQRLQRGNFNSWRSANTSASPAAKEAAQLAAVTGAPATATDLVTGTTARAVPLTGSGRRRKRVGSKRTLKGGILPALIPIIAAAIGAIPGIAGTAVGIASLKEQQRQFNKMYGNK